MTSHIHTKEKHCKDESKDEAQFFPTASSLILIRDTEEPALQAEVLQQALTVHSVTDG